MDLADSLKELEILRETGEPDGRKPVSLVINSQDLRRAPVWLRRRGHLDVKSIFITDLPPGSYADLDYKNLPAEAYSLDGLAQALDNDIIFMFPQEWTVRIASMAIPGLASKKVWLAGQNLIGSHNPMPKYYEKHATQLEKAFALLESASDRESFSRRVQALISGDPGWLRIAPFMEYHHPLIHPEVGDTLLDGGVSDMVEAQKILCDSIGDSGKIYGFEPISWMAEKAASALSTYPQYELICAGLAEKDGSAEFASLRDSSHMGIQAGADAELCKLRSIDSFVKERGIERVDCIKLDVEGAELSALKGGRELIQRDLPKLILCLYHRPADLFEIPLYLNSIAPQYTLHLAHSSAGFTDTILYAKAS